MGGTRLPHEATLTVLAALAALAVAVFAGACGSASPRPTPAPAATATLPATAPNPSPSPSPGLLSTLPTDVAAARLGLARALSAAGGDLCPPALVQSWKVTCASGDADGDGKPDEAYLVPLQAHDATTSFPAAVFVLRGSAAEIHSFTTASAADASRLGQAMFSFADRTGDGRGDVTFLTTGCTTRICSTSIHIEMWDGTAGRDAGPSALPMDNLDSISFQGTAAKSLLVEHGGIVVAPGAGPSRGVTRTFAFDGSRYSLRSTVFDRPTYLFQAIRDADATFDAGDFAAADAAYAAAIADTTLKDWKAENGKGVGRPALVAYALLRIAIGTAATGGDPNPALDQLIRTGKEPLFVNAGEVFRHAFQDNGGSVHTACVAVTRYLSLSTSSGDNPARLRDIFDYGYANLPAETFKDVCPL